MGDDSVDVVKINKLRAYFVTAEGNDFGIGIIAETAKEAKNLAFGSDVLYENEFIDLRVKWKRNVNAGGLPKGEVNLYEGLKRGIYDFGIGDCPTCEKDAESITFEDGVFSCESCRD